jgi:transcriptional regulator GlxA family with amidase domain
MHRIGVVVFPGVHLMSLAPVAVFEMANETAGKEIYDVRVLSEPGGLIKTSIGISVATEAFGEPDIDTLLVGAPAKIGTSTPALLDFLRKALGVTRRLAAPCTGAFVLAEAGVLDGRRATTHWFYARDLRARFPKIKVDEDRIFIQDGSVWTSAGMSAGLDLALAMVESDLGVDIARIVAKQMVIYHRRAGGQSQFSALLQLEPKSDRIQSAMTYARANLRAALSVEELAEVAHLSPRQFTRTFRTETGRSPARAVEQLRVEAARVMMEEGSHSVDVVAREAGFSSREHMRRAFVRAFGQPPQVIRRHAGQRAAVAEN